VLQRESPGHLARRRMSSGWERLRSGRHPAARRPRGFDGVSISWFCIFFSVRRPRRAGQARLQLRRRRRPTAGSVHERRPGI